MTDREIDRLLSNSAQPSQAVEAALLKQIGDSIAVSLRPVRPLPPNWVLVTGLIVVAVAVALIWADLLGFSGFNGLSPWARVEIFCTTGVLAWLVAHELVSESIPGSRRRMSQGALLTVACMALLGVFALTFRDYRTEHFLGAGGACLATGLGVGIPAASGSWLLLRRGFALNAVSAGLVAGLLAGLTGVAALELHCNNFQALHVLVWHTAVVPVSSAAGTLLGWSVQRRRQRLSAARIGVTSRNGLLLTLRRREQ